MTPPLRSDHALFLADDILSWLHVLLRLVSEGYRPSLLEVRTEMLSLLEELGGFDEVMKRHASPPEAQP